MSNHYFWASVAFGVCGLVLLTLALQVFARVRQAKQICERAFGVVVNDGRSTWSSMFDDAPSTVAFQPTIRFTTRRGEVVMWRTPYAATRFRFAQGSQVTMLYDPENPEHARLDLPGPDRLGCFLLAAAGMLAFMAAGLFLVARVRAAVAERYTAEDSELAPKRQLLETLVSIAASAAQAPEATATLGPPPATSVTLGPPPAASATLGPPRADTSDPGEAWMVGNSATLLHCVKGGCAPAFDNVGVNFHAVHGASASAAWVVGDGGLILRFDGKTWTKQESGVDVALRSVWARSEKDAWAVGDRGTVLRFDGDKWSKVELPVNRHQRGTLFTVRGPAAGGVWLTTSLRTVVEQQGSEWVERGYFPMKGSHIDVLAVGSPSEVRVGTRGFIRRWDGKRWVTENENDPFDLRAITVQGRDWWACGGQQIRQYDGAVWRRAAVAALRADREVLLAISMHGPSDGWSVGSEGVVLRYRGGGWLRMPSGTTETLRSVWAP